MTRKAEKQKRHSKNEKRSVNVERGFMFLRLRVLLVAAALLVAFGAWAGAQVFSRTAVDPPMVLSGADVGFRVTAYERSTPVGSFVVRVNGQWVPIKEDTTSPRISSR
jgi:hypothetical protein